MDSSDKLERTKLVMYQLWRIMMYSFREARHYLSTRRRFLQSILLHTSILDVVSSSHFIFFINFQ